MESTKTNILLLDSMMDLNDAKEAIDVLARTSLSDQAKCLYWSTPVGEFLKTSCNSGICYEYALGYVSQGDLDEIESRIWEWLCNWYKNNRLAKYKEFIFYKEFPLTNFLDNELVNLFIYIMKNIALIEKLIKNSENNNFVLVLSKTRIFSDVCGSIFKAKKIDYKVYNFSHSRNNIFHKPIFFNWGELPNLKSAIISTIYSFIEILSDVSTFFANGKNNLNKIIVIDHRVLKPGIQKLLERGYKVFLPNNIRAFLSKGNIRKRLFYINTFSAIKVDLINYIIIKLDMRRSAILARSIYDDLIGIKESKDFFTFKDLDFSQVSRTSFVNLIKKLPVFSRVCRKIEQQLIKNKFNLFVTNTPYGESRFYWHLCKKYNIKNAEYLHGIEIAKKFYSHNNNRADYLFLWGPKIKEAGLAREEFDNKQQIVIGNMSYDFLNQNNIGFDRKRFNLKEMDKVLLFDYVDDIDFSFSCFYSTDYCNRVLFSLLKIIPKFKDVTLIIKVHPLSNPANCQNLLKIFKPKNRVIILHKQDALSLIPMCNAVVSPGGTTLCVDTIVNKVPFVAANFSRCPYIPFQGYKAFLEVFDEKGLDAMLCKVLYDPFFLERYKQNLEEFTNDFCYRLDNNSTNRFVWALEDYLKN